MFYILGKNMMRFLSSFHDIVVNGTLWTLLGKWKFHPNEIQKWILQIKRNRLYEMTSVRRPHSWFIFYYSFNFSQSFSTPSPPPENSLLPQKVADVDHTNRFLLGLVSGNTWQIVYRELRRVRQDIYSFSSLLERLHWAGYFSQPKTTHCFT